MAEEALGSAPRDARPRNQDEARHGMVSERHWWEQKRAEEEVEDDVVDP